MAQPSTNTAHKHKVPWIPDQKGAWMMLLVPYWVGVIGGGFTWQHLLIFALWITGYALFFTGENWLRARRRAAYFPPVRAWLGATTALGVVNLWFCGALLPWLGIFAPLIAITTWQAFARKERSLLARTSEVIAASLMCAVTWDVGIRVHTSGSGISPVSRIISQTQPSSLPDINSTPPASGSASMPHSEAASALATDPTSSGHGAALSLPGLWDTNPLPLAYAENLTHIIVITALVMYYFWSTIPYVKSLVRERNSRGYLLLSIAVHAVGLIGACGLVIAHLVSWAVLAMWVLLCARAVAGTLLARAVMGTGTRAVTSPDAHTDATPPNKATPPFGVTPKKLLIIVGITETILSVLYASAVLV